MNIVKVAANSLAIIFIYFCFLDRMYERKYLKKRIYVLAFLLAVAVTLATVPLKLPAVNILRALLTINILCVLLYKLETKRSLVYNTVFVVCSIFMDIITVLIMSGVYNKSVAATIGSLQMMAISSVLYWIGSFFMYKLCVYIFKKQEQNTIKTKEIIFLFVLTLFEVCVLLYCFALVKNSTHGIFLILILVGFLMLNIYSTKLLENIGKMAQLKSDYDLLNQQAAIQLKHYQELVKKNDLSKKIAHDIKNHLQTIDMLYSSGDGAKALSYREALSTKVDKLSDGFQCSNPILSAIVSHQLQQAEINKISFELDIEDVSLDFIQDLDITAIFANLLDNAVEACLRLDESKRKICLKMWQFNDFIAINISNPVFEIPIKEGDFFKSTKKGHKQLGLINIQNAVEKYNGEFSARIIDGEFTVRIVI